MSVISLEWNLSSWVVCMYVSVYAVYSFSLTDTAVCMHKLHHVSCGCNITASLVLGSLVLYETYML